jgi:hypothetical protein
VGGGTAHLPACLLARPPACLPACLPACAQAHGHVQPLLRGVRRACSPRSLSPAALLPCRETYLNDTPFIAVDHGFRPNPRFPSLPPHIRSTGIGQLITRYSRPGLCTLHRIPARLVTGAQADRAVMACPQQLRHLLWTRLAHPCCVALLHPRTRACSADPAAPHPTPLDAAVVVPARSCLSVNPKARPDVEQVVARLSAALAAACGDTQPNPMAGSAAAGAASGSSAAVVVEVHEGGGAGAVIETGSWRRAINRDGTL